MRVRILAAAVTLLGFVTVIAAALFLQNQPAGQVHLRLSSEPFPLAVGPTTLLVSLSRDDGTPVDGAAVEVTGSMSHAHMLPLAGHTSRSTNGTYRVAMMVPIMGSWTLDVSAGETIR